LLVAIDTATRLMGIALYDGERVWAEESWYATGGQTTELMPALVRMLERRGITPPLLSAVAVNLGPGSFTGLRIGLALAKGLALALSIPLIGVPALDVVAYPYAESKLPTCAVLQAGRGRIYSALYQKKWGVWQRRSEPFLTTAEGLCDWIEQRFFPSGGKAPKGGRSKKVLLCGELRPEEARLFQARLGRGVIIASPASSLRRAGFLAELAWQRLAQGQTDDPVSLAPIYL